jgi:hypothetical protein
MVWPILLVALAAVVHIASGTKQLSIKWNPHINSYDLIHGRVDGFTAFAEFKNDINATGWSYLDIATNPKDDDVEQAYTAGLAEGLLTGDLINMYAQNTLGSYCTKPLSAYCQRLSDFVDKNFAWMQQQIDLYASTDPYWHQVRLFLMQLQGLIDAYSYHQTDRNVITKQFSFKPDITGLLIYQIGWDLGDLESALKSDKKRVVGNGACSALIKLTPGNTDLYVSQDTWTEYGTMLRVLKKYNISSHLVPGSDELVPGHAVSFSSYPAALLSGDDFYAISSGLVAIETTIGNENETLWSYIKPENSVFEGIRNMVANRLARSGKQWTDTFSRFNSGTYNNQWMVVDYKKFVAKQPQLADGLLFVLEQIPGMIMSRDATDVLRNQSYWASYNLAYFPEIFNASGSREQVAKYGDWFSYENSPREGKPHGCLEPMKAVTKGKPHVFERRMIHHANFRNR